MGKHDKGKAPKKSKKVKDKKGSKGMLGSEPLVVTDAEIAANTPRPVAFTANTPRSERVTRALAWAHVACGIVVKVADRDVPIRTPDGWVPGWVLGHHNLAGVASDRVLRGLVQSGQVEKRHRDLDTGDTAVEYRLIP